MSRRLQLVTGLLVHSLVNLAVMIHSSDERLPILNHIETMVRYTILSNLHSLPTDCPQRRNVLVETASGSAAQHLRYWLISQGELAAYSRIHNE